MQEVFKKRIMPIANTNIITEVYPSSKTFGIKAWTYGTLEDCYNKIQKLGYKINDPCVIIEK